MQMNDIKDTGYEIEELIELVATLTNKYVSAESTSVSYEAAQKLMDAVIYTIRTQKDSLSETALLSKLSTARQAYETGKKILIEKVKHTMEGYNQLVEYFDDFHNHCLKDTVVKGMPEFFKWYDVKYNPQDTLLTLDYPILKDLSNYEGIWRIEAYLQCIELEQLFLNKFDKAPVIEILSTYDASYRMMIDNLCEIVYQDVLCHLLAEKPMQERISRQEKMQILNQENVSKEKLNHLSETFIRTYYQNEQLISYLTPVVDGLLARMKKE